MLPDRPCTWFAALRLITACCVMIARREAPFVIVLSQIAVLDGCCCCLSVASILRASVLSISVTFCHVRVCVVVALSASLLSERFSFASHRRMSFAINLSVFLIHTSTPLGSLWVMWCVIVGVLVLAVVVLMWCSNFWVFFSSRLSPPCCFFSLESRFLCKYDR